MRPSEMKVVTPARLADALALLAEYGERARPLAGATDAMVRVKEGQWRVPVWVSVRALPELRQITVADGLVTIGASVPFGQMLRSAELRAHAPLLLEAVADIGSVQIQAMGTLGGNLGTASPAGDSLPPLFALEASVGLASEGGGERWVPVDSFMLGPGRSVRRPDELITAVRFAAQGPDERSRWQKLGLRGAQAISIVSLAMRLGVQQPRFARFALGAVGPTVLRARQAEAAFCHADRLDEGMLRSVGQMAWKEVAPISDVRASAEYRRQMAAALLQRGLLELVKPEGWQ